MAGVTLAARIRQFVGDTKGQAARHAFGDAGRLQPDIEAILAVVALDYFACGRIPLWNAPRAGGNAALAANAQTGLDGDDAVLLALPHGAGRTGPDAPRVLAVETGHKDEPHTRLSIDVVRTEGEDLARGRAGAELLVGLAMHLAGLAADAVGLVVA